MSIGSADDGDFDQLKVYILHDVFPNIFDNVIWWFFSEVPKMNPSNDALARVDGNKQHVNLDIMSALIRFTRWEKLH